MGRLIGYITMLIMIDLLFIVTGQITGLFSQSIIWGTIIDPIGIKDQNFWSILITGVTSLAIVGGVIAGLVTRSSDILIFILMGTTLALLIGDFYNIYIYLASINLVLAGFIMLPIMIIFTFTIIEWVRGKD